MLRPRIASFGVDVYFSSISHSRRRDEVVEHVLLLQLRAGAVPRLAVLAAAAQVGDGEHAAHLQPHQHGHAERRLLRDVEAAVAVQHQRRRCRSSPDRACW